MRPSPSSRLGARRPPRGFTLLEMLATLVLTSLVAALMWQAAAQFQRIEALLGEPRLGEVQDTVRAEWVRSALQGLLPGDLVRGDAMRGAADELSGWSTTVPSPDGRVMARIALRLVHDAASDRTTLWLRRLDRPDGMAAAAPDTPLLSWPGRSGRFSYRDAAGTWHERWPLAPVDGVSAPAGALATLPGAVRLDTGLVALPPLVAPVVSAVLPDPGAVLREGS